MDDTPTLRIAVVGAGMIGTRHAAVIAGLGEQARLAAVVDVNLAKAGALAANHGVPAHESLAAALAALDIDAVAVCTPTGTHGEVAIEALQAGRHVVIEKPAEITPERVDAIIAARDAAGKTVTVISQHRFDPATEIVLDTIRGGGLGRLTSGIASIDWWRGQSYYDSGDWRGTWKLDGGGALMNQGVHTVDLLVAALGTPVEVFAYTSRAAHERIDVEDIAVGVVKFDGGALGMLHASTAAFPGLSARLQVHGDRGSAVIDNDQLTYIHATPPGQAPEEIFYGGQGAGNQLEQYGLELGGAGSAGSDPADLSDAHERQYLDFLAAVRDGRAPRVGLEQNRLSLSVITGAYESARTGLPVRLA
jgi:UDP-N-acetyl-2-amino-2-deoxyglucuronate dehydrogenase